MFFHSWSAFKICSHHIHILSNCPCFFNYYAYICTNTICMMLMMMTMMMMVMMVMVTLVRTEKEMMRLRMKKRRV